MYLHCNKLLESENIGLIVSDVMMPKMDGYELCRQIKENIQFGHIPLILLTAKNSLESKVQDLENGAEAYIKKPYSPILLKVQIAAPN